MGRHRVHDYDAILAAVDQHRHPSGEINTTALATALGMGRTTLQNALKTIAKEGKLGFKPVLPGFEITQVTSTPKGDFIQQKPEKGPEFEVPEGHVVKGVSALVAGDGRTIQQWVKTQVSPAQQTRDDLIEMLREFRGLSALVYPPVRMPDDQLVTVYPTSDLHIGMLAWGRETGAKWDLKIARETILGSMRELVQCAPDSHTAILLDMGDYTHNNGQNNETPASGHQLDVDGRFPKIGREAMRLRVDLIHMALEKHQRVIVRCLPGNHDPEVAQMISIAMALLFENNPRVTIDDDPSDFWFHEHGIVMLCANHGHRTKPEKLPGVMASYRPEMWGRTKVRQAFSGHIHHTKSGEDMGARWETLRTAAPRDAYAHQHGYSAGRELIALTYHRERGLRSRQVVEIL